MRLYLSPFFTAKSFTSCFYCLVHIRFCTSRDTGNNLSIRRIPHINTFTNTTIYPFSIDIHFKLVQNKSSHPFFFYSDKIRYSCPHPHAILFLSSYLLHLKEDI